MASLSFTQFHTLPRWHSNWPSSSSIKLVQLLDIRLQSRLVLTAASKKKIAESLSEEVSGEVVEVKKKSPRKTTKQAPAKSRKKPVSDTSEETLSQSISDSDTEDEENIAESFSEAASEEVVEVKEKTPRKTTKRAPAKSRKEPVSQTPEETSYLTMSDSNTDEETIAPSASSEGSKKPQRRMRKEVISTSSSQEGEETKKKVTRRTRTKKTVEDSKDEVGESDLSDLEEDFPFIVVNDGDDENDLEVEIDEGEDISYTYGSSPLVCCFGAAQDSFLPSGRPANRLVDYETLERKKGAVWAPEKFVRAPGGSASDVALALATLGGKVAFMGKLGEDEFGESLLYRLNWNNVQTRSVRLDTEKLTAVSHMKIVRKGRLRTACVKPSPEDSLSRDEINIDVLKEAKMFYFNTFSLIYPNMRSTALQAIKISKKFGGDIFYDLNLPLPLWKSAEETKMFIKRAWDLADIIEITKQELEFLCGIKPSEKFDTKDNDRSKFIHYKPEVIAPLWHENLKVLFVTNGSSKVHYYTKEHHGSVSGTEEARITPYTSDMSATGDGIVAALLKKLTGHPDLLTDERLLQRSIQYAVDSGARAQWIQAQIRGFPPREGMEGVVPDDNGIRSVTEREYRTLVPDIDNIGSLVPDFDNMDNIEPADREYRQLTQKLVD